MLIIDRFEGLFAVCETENKEFINLERSNLPKESKEGDVLIQINGQYVIDASETERRKERIKALMDDIFS